MLIFDEISSKDKEFKYDCTKMIYKKKIRPPHHTKPHKVLDFSTDPPLMEFEDLYYRIHLDFRISFSDH